MIISCGHVISNELNHSVISNGSTSITCISSLAETLIEQFFQLRPKRIVLIMSAFGGTLEPTAGVADLLGSVALQKERINVARRVLHAVLIEHYGVSRNAHGGEAVVLRDHNIAGLNPLLLILLTQYFEALVSLPDFWFFLKAKKSNLLFSRARTSIDSCSHHDQILYFHLNLMCKFLLRIIRNSYMADVSNHAEKRHGLMTPALAAPQCCRTSDLQKHPALQVYLSCPAFRAK